jgi:hypothetical protein
VTRTRASLLVAAVVVLVTGCATGTDDELAPPPTRTITATPSQSLAPAPATVPVGTGDVSPSDVVWAQGTVLHVGRRQADLEPLEIDSLVVVEGGVFVLSGGELWFTDLARLRGTAQTEVTGLRTNADASRLEVTDTRSGTPVAQGYDTRTGKAVRGDVDTLTPAERGREPDVRPAGLPRAFDMGVWTSDTEFYGVGGAGARRRIVACDLVADRCAPGVPVTGPQPVVFPTGR